MIDLFGFSLSDYIRRIRCVGIGLTKGVVDVVVVVVIISRPVLEHLVKVDRCSGGDTCGGPSDSSLS